MEWIQYVFDGVLVLLASSGFWAFLKEKKNDRSATKRLLLGLAHDRIMFLGGSYIKRGYITKEEYDDYRTYLYDPYEESGGNGSGAKVMLEVDKLPLYDPTTWPPKGGNDDSSTKPEGV